MSRSMLVAQVYPPPDYFDLTSREISEIEIKKKSDGSTCLIVLRKDSGVLFKGFKLTDNPKIDIYCDLTFFPSKETGKYVPRLTLKKVDKNLTTKEQQGKQKVIINLDDSKTAENFWKTIGFLFSFKSFVEVDAFEKSYKVIDSDSYILEFDSKEQAEKIRTLSELVKKSNLSDAEIENVLKGSRELNLKHFERLLNEKDSWKEYEEKYKDEMMGTGQEAVWHHFLKKHHWFLGLNVDIRFIRELITEGNVGVPDTEGRGSPLADFVGINDYTALIELKTPETKIFTSTKRNTARSNTWSFSSDFIDGVSQCLGQKFDWDKGSGAKQLVKGAKVLDQNTLRTVDPKSIFLIGNKCEEISTISNDVEIITKRDTFERFRRNCRNVEILTFDELYERAYFIVHGERNEFGKQND